jgi:hypothetical protein
MMIIVKLLVFMWLIGLISVFITFLLELFFT